MLRHPGRIVELMIIRKIAVLFLFIFLITPLQCAAAETRPAPTLNQSMSEIGAVMLDIYPLIVSRREMTPQERLVLSTALQKITSLFNSISPQIAKKSLAYQINYDFVLEYLRLTQFVFDSGDLDYARSHLYALGEICATCHTQDTKLRTLFSGAKRNQFNDDFAFAEFNFFTRNYDKAIKYYKKDLAATGRKTELEIMQPLQRLATIYTQIKKQPGDGVTLLRSYKKLRGHSPDTALQLNYWIEGLLQLKQYELAGKVDLSFVELQAKVARYLGDLDKISITIESSAKDEIYHVWLRGQLFHYMNQHRGDPNIPKILYWLAIIDKSIAHNFYFSQSVLFLKQCVLAYPQHAYARRCLNDYKSYIDFTYRRYGEQALPEEIEQEIIELDKSINSVTTEVPS